MKAFKSNSINCHYDFGFTLIELLVVIIMISIMAVTVLPKFFSSNGFEEYTYRDELITKLRAIQLRSMQQTTDTVCHQIQMQSSLNPNIIGLQDTDPIAVDKCRITNPAPPPKFCYTDTNNSNTVCYAGDTTTIIVDPKHNVSFAISEGLTSFNFSHLGKPEGCIVEDPCKVEITIAGESSVKIEINTEGFIHAIP
ncbi:prepilin-type N-terminal cleavage/methylation domain-containing protein [Colwellia psychrerythraea]|uniref:MSHA pilin protein MshC n=1 Tax=Colwellia psychrerythraea TaxID=28229 RepID=A0A099KRS3_COLPS|nr:prepilin-type N-terminal cleavage/methylation domain-containing protein [Colwellia psychrerythraea]KGJ92363.1 hypothetical protein GAB14E_0485 [Colwellia psychrerythraea]